MAQHMENIINELNSKIDTMNATVIKQSEIQERMTANLKNLYDITMATVPEIYIQKHETNVLGEIGKTAYKLANVTSASSYKNTAWYSLKNKANTLIYSNDVTVKGTGNAYVGLKYTNEYLLKNQKRVERTTYNDVNYVAYITNGMMFNVQILVNNELKIETKIGSTSLYYGGYLSGGKVFTRSSFGDAIASNMTVDEWANDKELNTIPSEITRIKNEEIEVKAGDTITVNVYIADDLIKGKGMSVVTPQLGGVSNSDALWSEFDTKLEITLVGETMAGLVG